MTSLNQLNSRYIPNQVEYLNTRAHLKALVENAMAVDGLVKTCEPVIILYADV